ncbi:hypothetical protein ZWY2020_029421 [Hordeum vulgare]|nr:hypothetical protein ZWY2020_029421 [Hordeum vulgare]
MFLLLFSLSALPSRPRLLLLRFTRRRPPAGLVQIRTPSGLSLPFDLLPCRRHCPRDPVPTDNLTLKK